MIRKERAVPRQQRLDASLPLLPAAQVQAQVDGVERYISLEPRSRVLDLACGGGELLSELIAEKHVRGSGVEIDQAAVEKCIGRGLSVFNGDLDAGLADFDDQSHDVVILSLSLQQLRRPRMIVREMVRVGQLAIVSFPNFAHWVPRSQLLLRGRMPVSRDLPHQWWDTPNIHLCTIRDFEALCREEGLRIEHVQYLRSVEKPPPARVVVPNLLARIAIFAVTRA